MAAQTQPSDVTFVVQRGGVGHNDSDLQAIHDLSSADIIGAVAGVKNRTLVPAVSVTEAQFGGIDANGNWRSAAQAALTYAAARGYALYWPPSSTAYQVTFDATNTSLTAATSVEIFGAGWDSHIKVGPDPPNGFTYILFDMPAGGVRYIHDLWIEGPANPGTAAFDGSGNINQYGPTTVNTIAVRTKGNPLSQRVALDGIIDIGVDATLLTSTVMGFVAGDVGKAIVISDNGDGTFGGDLTTTVASFVDAANVHLAAPAAASGTDLSITLTRAGTSTPANPDPDVRMERVKVSGWFRQWGEIASGNYQATVVGCDLQAWVGATSGAADGQKKKFHAYDCTFRRDPNFVNSKRHHLYINPNVAVDLDKCRFYNGHGSSSYGLHHYGHATDAPDYTRITNCFFDSTCDNGVLVAVNDPQPYIADCTFNNTARSINLKSKGVQVVGGQFAGQIRGPSTGATANVVDIVGARFTTGSIVPNGPAGTVWTVRASSFWSPAVQIAGSIIDISTAASDVDLRVTGCTFNVLAATGSPAVLRWAKGRVVFADCVFLGDYSGDGIVFNSGTVTASLDFQRCEFRQTAGVTLTSSTQATIDGKVTATDCYYDNPSSTVGLPQVGSGRYLAFKPRAWPLAGPAIASAGTINPTFNFDTYHVTGTATINNIQFHANASAERCSAGRIELIADGAWALGAGAGAGAIVPKSAGTAKTVGTVTVLRKDPATGNWYEIAT